VAPLLLTAPRLAAGRESQLVFWVFWVGLLGVLGEWPSWDGREL
jgi:hypothetical protein